MRTEPIPERKRYYNPVLDPHCEKKMTPKMLKAVRDQQYEDGGPLEEPDSSHPTNLVSSLCEDGLHRPAIDIDIECELIPSSQPGHYHLYFPTLALDWAAYAKLLGALVEAGIVDQKYFDHSLVRGQTLLRPPWVKKHWIDQVDEPDQNF